MSRISDRECLDIIADCEVNQEKLTEWEQGFVSSLTSKVESGRGLTLKQEKALIKIHGKAVSEE